MTRVWKPSMLEPPASAELTRSVRVMVHSWSIVTCFMYSIFDGSLPAKSEVISS